MNRPTRLLSTLALLAITAAACSSTTEPGTDDPADGAPSIAITSPSDGATVEGNVVALDVDVNDFDIVAPDGDTSGTTGHYHVFIDQEPVADGETIGRTEGIIHSADDPIMIGGLTSGEHTITVVLGDGTHARVGDAAASITVEVAGPTVTASAAVEGSDVTVTAEVEGIDLVVEPPSEEHLHFFLNTEPVFGEPVPTDDTTIIHSRETTVTFEDVEPGDHTIWVVAGDVDHVPLDPPVWTQLTVTVE